MRKLILPAVIGLLTVAAPLNAQVTPPSIVTQPEDLTIVVGDYVYFEVTASGTPPLSYQWRKNGSSISGATDAIYLKDPSVTTDAGAYTCRVSNSGGAVTSVVATLTVLVPPAITMQPVGGTFIAGSNVTFTVRATGSSPLQYQWFQDGFPLAGATSTNLTILNVQPEHEGDYVVIVRNAAVDYGADEAESNPAMLIVLVPPTILDEPEDDEVVEGDYVLFSVVADGTDTDYCPLTYQWRKNGAVISGETDSILEIFEVLPSDAGNYSVDVVNNAGTAKSRNATLTVLSPPTITTQPANRTVYVGSNVTFTVSVTGTPPFDYQWMFQGEDIPDATAAALTFPVTNTSQRGLYSVAVSNVVTFTESTDAYLRVIAETVAPVVNITTPSDNSFWSNATLTVIGTASDNVELDYVKWQLDGTAAMNDRAVGTTNWVATFPAKPGLNDFYCRAVDTSGNESFFKRSRIFYVVPTPLNLIINGGGTVSPYTNGQMLIIQTTYQMTATNAPGWVFTNWTGSFTTTTNRTLTFVMQSNFTARANFVDVQPPTVTVTTPLPGGLVNNPVAVVSGTASDNGPLASVWYRFNSNAWATATGTTNWSATVTLVSGTNSFSVYSQDAAGRRSPTNTTITTVTLGAPAPVITRITRTGSIVGVTFTSVTGLNYNLEYKATPVSATWTSLPPAMPGTGSTMTLSDTNPVAASRYYRVRAQ